MANNPSTIRVWDNHNKQWLVPMSIIFDDGDIVQINARNEGVTDVLKDGWRALKGNDLKKVAVTGSIEFNTKLLPKSK